MAITVETLDEQGQVVLVEDPTTPAPAPAPAPAGPPPDRSPGQAEPAQPAPAPPAPAPYRDTGADDAPQGVDGGDFDEPAVPRSVQRRFDTLTRQREEARREAQQMRDRLAQLEGQLQVLRPPPEQEPARPEEPRAPHVDDYATESDYLEAKVEWLVQERLSEAERARDEAARQQQATERAMQAVQALESREAAFRQQVPDYDARVADLGSAGMTRQLYEALRLHDQGPALAYWLAQHPADVQRLGTLEPFQVWRELGKLEGQLGGSTTPVSPASTPPALDRSPGQAPARGRPVPLTPVGSQGGGASYPDLADPTLSQKAWEAEYARRHGPVRTTRG